MRIIRLEAENFKRLKAVEISPDGNLVVISGKNGAGKSSVLDAITAALGGTSTKTTPRPIRDGEDKAQIVLELDEIIVTRTFTGGTTKLTVKGKDGSTFAKGQAKLDDLIGKLSLDPLAFTQLSDKEQVKTLLALVDLPFDPARLDAERAEVYAERTDTNRRVKGLKAALDQHTAHPDAPDAEVSVSALLDEYRKAQEMNDKITEAHQRANYAADRVTQLKAELEAAEAEAAEAKHRSETAPALKDLDGIKSRLDNAETTNAHVREHKAHLAAVAEFKGAEGESAALTAKLDDIDQRKAGGLEAAEFPVAGLAFDEDGVTYRGVPFKQASSAEQLRVSLAMAMALHPELRVIRIADGSLLDAANLALIEEMAKTQDYQVWLEMVSDDDGRGIVIEEGAIA